MSYRINGFKQIEAFYSIVFSGKYDISPQHISLYMFLLNQNNRSNWVEWFKCPYDLAMNGAMIGSKKTYYKCLTDLKEWGLINYIAGENQFKAPKISLLRLENAPQLAPQCEPASEPLPIPACELLPTTARVTYINYISSKFNNLITNNFKQLKELDFDFENFFDISVKKKPTEKREPNTELKIELPFLSKDFEDAWKMLIRQPKWKKKSQDALTTSLKKFEGVSELYAIKMIENAIANGWQGLFPLNDKDQAEVVRLETLKKIQERDKNPKNQF